MKYKIIVLVYLVLFGSKVFGQNNGCDSCWDPSDSTNAAYFYGLTFMGATGDAALAQIKVDFEDSDCYIFASYQVIRGFLERKFGLDESKVSYKELNEFTRKFIRNGDKLKLSDTSIWKKYVYSHYYKDLLKESSTLSSYRNMGLKNFIINHCEGNKIINTNIFIMAYLFEMRVLTIGYGSYIGNTVYELIKQKCKIEWDEVSHKWIEY